MNMMLTFDLKHNFLFVNAMLLFEETHVSLIYLDGNVRRTSCMVVKSGMVDVSKYLKKKQLCKYFYPSDVREWYDPGTVVSRARSKLDAAASKLPFKDPEHFAMWCKTGTYQLHSEEQDPGFREDEGQNEAA